MEFLPQLKDDSRIWFYFSERPLEIPEQIAVTAAMHDFFVDWKAHGKSLDAEFHLHGDQVLIIGVDESNQVATGCSIDSQVLFIRDLGKRLNIDFFNRQLLAIKENDKLRVLSFDTLNQELKADLDAKEVVVLDHMLLSLGGLRTKGLLPLQDSWHKNLISN